VGQKISIVTPSFNQGDYIEQTICSVLDQNYPNLQYIIIDGGSTDGTVEVIKKYEKHLAFWTSEPDSGQTDAINRGFHRCTGDIFNWINSDDYYEPGTFAKLAAHFSDPSVDVVCGQERPFYHDQPEQDLNLTRSFIHRDLYKTIQTGIIDQPCTFFRKEKIAPFFPLHTPLRYVMDRQLWWQYLLRYGQTNIKVVDDVFTHFRLHHGSKSVAESAGFEKEFEGLKRSLLIQACAPKVLLQQVKRNDLPPEIEWHIQPGDQEKLLAAFASFYAHRNYVRKNRYELQALTALVKKWKAFGMTADEWKWWVCAHLMPQPLFTYFKNKPRS
jgi:glycosyltransferase involved in cell wall biosynthesis